MRRRRALNDYLRAQDPVAGGDALRSSGTPAARRAVPRARLVPLSGGVVALAVGALVVAGLWPGSAPSPAPVLSPQDAVAAAAASLDHDGILEWSDRQGYSPEKASRQGPTDGWAEITRWVDLRTGDHSSENTNVLFPPGRGRRESTVYTWSVGRSGWLDEGERSKTAGKRIVRHTIRDHSPSAYAAAHTPLVNLKRSLARAARGELPVENGGTIDGVPVVVITERYGGAFTSRTWVTKERSPRIIRSANTMACMKDTNCSNISDDGTPHGASTTTTETLRWTIHPRTDRWLAKVHPPRFDPATYSVVTTHRP